MSQNHLITQWRLFENSKKEIESQERERYIPDPKRKMHRANLAEINQVWEGKMCYKQENNMKRKLKNF